jgi:hypothetical protein
MRFFTCSFLFLIVLSCSNSKSKHKQFIDYAPNNSEIILKSSNIEGFKSAITNNAFFNTLSETKGYTSLKNTLTPISKLNIEGDAIICLSKSKQDSLIFTLATKFSKTVFVTDSLKNYTEEHLKYKPFGITRSTLEDEVFFSAVIDSTFLVSSSKETLLNIFNQEEGDTLNLKQLYAVAGANENASVLINTTSTLAPSFFIEDDLKSSDLSDFLILDTQISEDDIYFNGIAKSKDSSLNIIDLFKNTIPQENQLQHITPGNSDGYLSFTFDDFMVFNENLKVFHHRDSISKHKTLFNAIIEIGVIYEDKNRAIVLNSIDVIATQDALLGEQNTIDTYRGITLFEFSESTIFQETFNPFMSNISVSKYCIIDNYFVFANTKEQLQNIIANYQNKTTFGSKSYFKELSENLSTESSLMFVAKPQLLESVIETSITKGRSINLKDYKLSAIQYIYDTNFAHVHGNIIKGEETKTQDEISETFTLKLDADLLSNPQFVTNHITKQKEIIVQDINNTLYLISNKGKVLWKKQLNSAVIGDIEQIDIYKNGRLQLAFSTENSVNVIDRKGRDVAPFPIKLKDKITQPLSVFDYDNTKKYRLLVTQGNEVLLYDAKAKIVSGFTFSSADSEILSQPKHFRIGTKDYLVFKTKNKLYIIDRTGKTRVLPKSKNTLSKEPIFLYKNNFTTTTESGALISVDSKGNVSKVNLNLGNSHYLETTSKTRVTFHDNTLGIKSRTIELDYGNYTRPSIFYISDKIYVTITDLQAKKIYVFDSQGKLLPNFPVYANSSIDLDNIDSDKSLEFVTKGDSNSIILYQIN